MVQPLSSNSAMATCVETCTISGVRPDQIGARAIDDRTCRAWIGHPKLFVIDNSTGFEGKMQRLVDTAASLCGIPTTVKASRKFLLKRAPLTSAIPMHHEDFEVEKVYLNPESASTSCPKNTGEFSDTLVLTKQTGCVSV